MSTTTTYPRASVTTWANGFGRWHARVMLSSGGMTPTEYRAHRSAIRRRAQHAIRRELSARGELGCGYRVRVVPAEFDATTIGDNGRITSVVYAENWDD